VEFNREPKEWSYQRLKSLEIEAKILFKINLCNTKETLKKKKKKQDFLKCARVSIYFRASFVFFHQKEKVKVRV